MTDIVITPDNVEQAEGATVRHGIAAEAVDAGQALYRLADGTLGLADADDADAAVHKAVGIALHPAAQGQPIAYQTAGRIAIGATVVQGTIYVLSATAGGIAPAADLGNPDEVVLIGVGYDAAHLQLNIWPTGIAVP